MMRESEWDAQAVTDEDWIDWSANCDPAELDDYCFLMHDILGGRLGPEFEEDWILIAWPRPMEDCISMQIGWWPGPAFRGQGRKKRMMLKRLSRAILFVQE